MKVSEAFSIIDNVCAKTPGTRQDHAVITEALKVIADELNKAADQKPESGE